MWLKNNNILSNFAKMVEPLDGEPDFKCSISDCCNAVDDLCNYCPKVQNYNNLRIIVSSIVRKLKSIVTLFTEIT